MAITKSFTNADSVVRRQQGRYLDSAGSPALATISIGFTPRYFKWHDITDRTSVEKYEGMAAADTLTTDVNGVQALDTNSLITFDAGSGNQTGGSGTPDATNAGVVNNVAYPGPSTIINDTKTQIPGSGPAQTVTVAASQIVQNKQYEWVAQG